MGMLKKAVFILLVAPIVTGCSSLADKSEMTKRAELNAVNLQESAQTLMSQLEPEMAKQKSANMAFYAPLHWKLARDSFDEAVKLSSKSAPEAEIKKHLLIVKDCIDAMPETKETALKETADLIDYFKHLQKIEANKAYPKDYAKLIDDLRKVMEKIDVPDLAAARKEQQSLLKDMVELEVKTITFQQTSFAEIALERAEDNDADDTAEQSFEKAEVSLEQAKRIIKDNPRNNDPIVAASVQAFIEANHASSVAKEVKSIIDALDNDDIEENALEGVVLRFEVSMSTISKGFGIDDIRYLTLSDQADLLADYARSLSAGIKKTIELPPYINKNYPPNSVESSELMLPPEFLI